MDLGIKCHHTGIHIFDLETPKGRCHHCKAVFIMKKIMRPTVGRPKKLQANYYIDRAA